MPSSRPSNHLLHTLPTFRPRLRFSIHQWHPRTPLRRRTFNTAPPTTQQLPRSYKPRSSRRLRRPLLWALAFGISGFVLGKSMTAAFTLFDNVERDSEEDVLLRKAIVVAADDIPFVRKMLRRHDGDEEWEEVAMAPLEGDTLVNDTLRGSMGLVTPRGFWNEKDGEFVMVVYYGGALCGWPGIAHGGCTATVLLEGMERALNCLTGGGRSNIRPPEPSELGLTYLKPVKAGMFYLLKAKFKTGGDDEEQVLRPEMGISADKDLAKRVHEEKEKSGIVARLNRKYDVDCTLENLDGLACMKAKGVWDIL